MTLDPTYVRDVLHRLAQDKAGVTLAFGAGRRTIEALECDPDAARAALDGIIDDDASRAGQTICGITVRKPAEWARRPVRRILICSEMFEQQLALRARVLFGENVEIVTAFDRGVSLVASLADAQRAIDQHWSTAQDREALWLAADRLMSAIHDRLRDLPEWRYGPKRQIAEFEALCNAIGGIDRLNGGAVLNAGCGRYHPHGLSVLALLAGAARCTALDLEEPMDARRSAHATAELVSHVLLDPAPLGISRSEALERAQQLFDLAALQHGDLDRPIRLPRALQHEIGSIDDDDIATGPFDVIVSRDVLEHVTDVPAALAALHRRLMPGGVFVAWIDFSDHRRYANAGRFAHWSSMTESRDDAQADHAVPRDTNGLRYPQYVSLFERAGFDVVRYEPTEIEPVPAHVRPRLAPMYREMSDDDLAVCRAIAVLTRSEASFTVTREEFARAGSR